MQRSLSRGGVCIALIISSAANNEIPGAIPVTVYANYTIDIIMMAHDRGRYRGTVQQSIAMLKTIDLMKRHLMVL